MIWFDGTYHVIILIIYCDMFGVVGEQTVASRARDEPEWLCVFFLPDVGFCLREIEHRNFKTLAFRGSICTTLAAGWSIQPQQAFMTAMDAVWWSCWQWKRSNRNPHGSCPTHGKNQWGVSWGFYSDTRQSANWTPFIGCVHMPTINIM